MSVVRQRRNNVCLLCMSISALLLCCNGASIQQKLDIMQAVPVNLDLDHMECWQNDSLLDSRPWEDTPLKLCVYVSPENCTSCYLKKMFQWDDFIEMEKVGKFYIFFIFTPQDGCEDDFHRFFYQVRLNHPFYLDKRKEFLTKKPQIPKETMFHIFLIDEDNNIILVGDVLHNISVEERLREILDEYEKSHRGEK